MEKYNAIKAGGIIQSVSLKMDHLTTEDRRGKRLVHLFLDEFLPDSCAPETLAYFVNAFKETLEQMQKKD